MGAVGNTSRSSTIYTISEGPKTVCRLPSFFFLRYASTSCVLEGAALPFTSQVQRARGVHRRPATHMSAMSTSRSVLRLWSPSSIRSGSAASRRVSVGSGFSRRVRRTIPCSRRASARSRSSTVVARLSAADIKGCVLAIDVGGGHQPIIRSFCSTWTCRAHHSGLYTPFVHQSAPLVSAGSSGDCQVQTPQCLRG